FSSFLVFVCVVYVRPSCRLSVFREIWKQIEQVLELGRPTIILGDFNARHPEFGDVDAARSGKGKIILQCCDELALTLLNTRDCFEQGTRGDSVLDLAFTNEPEMFALRVGRLPFSSDLSSLSILVDPR